MKIWNNEQNIVSGADLTCKKNCRVETIRRKKTELEGSLDAKQIGAFVYFLFFSFSQGGEVICFFHLFFFKWEYNNPNRWQMWGHLLFVKCYTLVYSSNFLLFVVFLERVISLVNGPTKKKKKKKEKLREKNNM